MLTRSKLCRFCPSPSAQAPQRLLSVQGRSSSSLPQLQMRLQEPIQGDTQCRINTVNIWDSRNIKRWKLDGWMKVSDTRMCDGMTGTFFSVLSILSRASADTLLALSAQSHRPVPTVILADGCDRRRTSLAVGEHAACLSILTNISAISKWLVQRGPHIVHLFHAQLDIHTQTPFTFPAHLPSPALHGNLPPAHSAEPSPRLALTAAPSAEYRSHLYGSSGGF
ncbi:hypothetical protein C8F01DRAFT_1137893 [Mycena amicta]|nr:hypothetical protein C8F01DRAFT_1137893 [Mycena amicta]